MFFEVGYYAMELYKAPQALTLVVQMKTRLSRDFSLVLPLLSHNAHQDGDFLHQQKKKMQQQH